MGLIRTIRRNFRKMKRGYYYLLDRLYVASDLKRVRRTRNLRLIPGGKNRRGGKTSYAEWAHATGIFQTLMYLYLESKENNEILDVGCGTGLLGIPSEPFLYPEGHYTGIDVIKEDIEFCRSHYPSPMFKFVHLDVNNPAYAKEQADRYVPWPLESDKFDLVTAASVWTHLNEKDATYYFKEIERVLKPGCKAIVTFFQLDDNYRKSLAIRSEEQGRFHMTKQSWWVFDQSCYGSDAWLHTKRARVPESAVGITNEGLKRLTAGTKLELIEYLQGNWKEIPGVYFQDVLVFQKM